MDDNHSDENDYLKAGDHDLTTDIGLADSLLEYFSGEPYGWEVTKVRGETVRRRVANDLPTPAGWCASVGWSERRLSERVAGSPVVADAAEVCATAMKHHIVTNGLSKGVYEGGFAVLAAKNLIGWSEKVETLARTETVLSEADRRMLARAGVLTLDAVGEVPGEVLDTGVSGSA